MPRHLIRDAHEWINEILTVPIYALANPQSRERAWQRRRGKKTLLSLTLVWFEKWFWRCRISGSSNAKLKYHYFEHCFSQCMEKEGREESVSALSCLYSWFNHYIHGARVYTPPCCKMGCAWGWRDEFDCRWLEFFKGLCSASKIHCIGRSALKFTL